MDVERIQKINNLALDLVKQGLAKDRDDAIKQAELVYKGQAQEYNEMRETMQEKEEAPQVELSQGRVEEILQQNTQFLVRQIKTFQEKITALEGELAAVKNQLTYNKLPTVQEIVVKKEERQQEVPEEAPVTAEQQITENKETHPRSGNYNEDDVSVEKFFYMGSK
jgi:hypothetical protein